MSEIVMPRGQDPELTRVLDRFSAEHRPLASLTRQERVSAEEPRLIEWG